MSYMYLVRLSWQPNNSVEKVSGPIRRPAKLGRSVFIENLKLGSSKENDLTNV